MKSNLGKTDNPLPIRTNKKLLCYKCKKRKQCKLYKILRGYVPQYDIEISHCKRFE